ncbi:hypothetical protein PK35_05020 [Tamlana nanhaiensis]|uniref:Uncharacterized protein n=1 Tax=Neotamlana nanhaiensis TaxID=1382798 RepID=A0A0D7W4X0_9FLAO|nr:hypothetical protein [Tamlana nanhaiensis]KJD34094.1 hypothetical protein PK35_05020 [Tamlana nanhaiensis]
MSKDLQPSSQKSEEVDLGQLFTVIGNVFNRFIGFIVSIFKGVYKIILLLLLHIYKRIFWYIGSLILGLIIGGFIDFNSEKVYGANMYVETNFKSARQVYENIKQFNQLAEEDKDSLELAKILNISVSDAAKIKGFYIEPDLDENVMAKMYSDFYKHLDSISKVEMNYELYKQSLTPYNFVIHRIGVASVDKYLYQKIEASFTKELSGNEYLKQLLSVNRDNLGKKDKTLKEQISKTDSLVNEYLKIRINQSNKEAMADSSTNLYMGAPDNNNNNLVVNEASILEKKLDLEQERRQINVSKVEQQSVVNVLAGFPKSGYDISVWHQKKKFTLPIMFFVATFLFFLLFGLKKYLDSESKNLSI